MRFEFSETPIRGVFVIQKMPQRDHRGLFERLYCVDDLRPVIGERQIVQINRSCTAREGTVRGMHFQHSPFAELKMVQCMAGKVFDVAVDLRRDSPSFLQWYGFVLDDENACALVIPEGVAHGFQTLTNDTAMLYFHTARYNPSGESGVNAFDPRIGIEWPRPVTEQSPRDQRLAHLPASFSGIVV